MEIHPTKPGSTPKTGAGRLDRGSAPLPAQSEEHTTSEEAAKAARDKVQISDEARSLQEQLQHERDLIAQLPPGRLREVLERIYNGFYDRPEVRDVVLQRLAEDLEVPPKTQES